ncbi:MAG TPA: hypothetical protein DF383_11230 [Deltaproteobacteria bacterium]|nr:hypothetical protein [Deltaproteobacteria bacterium]
MAAFKIFEIQVNTTKEGAIELSQGDTMDDNSYSVIISPDQVDLLIQHLKAAQAELKSQSN